MRIRSHRWLAIILMAATIPASAQWTWIRGSKLRDLNGVYGTRGTPSTLNDPGARLSSVSWTDVSGNLWLFGGDGYSTIASTGLLNDLWKYDPGADTWTWMAGDNTRNSNGVYGTRGSPAAANKPGSRSQAISWTDAAGRLWLFGGYGYPASGPAGYLNDLWRYDPATLEWTWLAGSNGINSTGSYGTQGMPSTAAIPGARRGSSAWKDAAGDLWLVGGEGYPASGAQGYLNDLWRLNPNTLEWTWVGGSTLRDRNGLYGTRGVAAEANLPGARSGATSWTDATGGIWLFGGYGFPETGAQGYLADLWRYDPATNRWAWMQGPRDRNANGVYGSQGVPSATHMPGARTNAARVTDASGKLWLFGGEGYPEAGSLGDLNDLWRYDPATGLWTWMFGRKTRNENGVYGTQNVAGPANTPGARSAPAFWDDGAGRLWLFGGYGLPETGAIGRLNDLWAIYSNSLNLFFRDADADGYGDPNTGILSATAPAGHVGNGADCDDLLPSVYPGAPEVCDNRDNDCDGLTDEGTSYVTYHRDADGDGYGSPTDTLLSCAGPSPGYVTDGSDCDDTRGTVNPGAPEVCDGLDNDCDGQVDEGVLTTWYRDADGDGHGSPTETTLACSAPPGFVASADDCLDSNPSVYPGAPEVCDGLDNDCDGRFEPSAPFILTATPGRGSAILDFTPPAVNGGAPILNYAYSLDGSPVWTPLSPADAVPPIEITGLVNGRTYQIRLRALNGVLSCYASAPVTVVPDADPIWTGAVSRDWANPANWLTNAVPLPGDDITIPSGLVNYPVLDMARTVGNVVLDAGATLTLNGNTLTIGGALTGTGLFVGSPTSGLMVTGDLGSLRFSQASPSDNALGHLSLTPGASATLASGLAIQEALLLDAAALDLAGNALVLRSTASGTARVGDLTGSQLTGATQVTVERYIPQTLGTSNIGRRWRVLTSPVTNTTVNRAWQDGTTWSGTSPLNGSTGTLINGNRQGTAATANANGYDFWSAAATAGASICRYVTASAQGSWGTLPGTLAPGAFDGEKAYLLYIRGPRASTFSTGTASAATTLRPTGTLKQGDVNVTLPPNTAFVLVGNPYASPLDFDRVYDNPGNSSLIKRQFWVWDASLGDGGNYRLIKYLNGQYVSMPESTPTSLSSIQSGQGFFVESINPAGGILRIVESDKTAAAPTPVNVLFARPGMPRLVAGLERTEPGFGTRHMDEVASLLDGRYHAGPTDADDAVRPVASDGHLAFRRLGAGLVLDARPLPAGRDTLRLALQNLAPGGYVLRLHLQGLAAVVAQAWLWDAEEGTLLPLRLDGAEAVHPFTLASAVDSVGRVRFAIILSVHGSALAASPEGADAGRMRVWPNPVVGRRFHLQTPELTAGGYVTEVLGADGVEVFRKPWTHTGGGAVLRVDLPWGMPSGRYTLRILRDGRQLLQAALLVE